VLSERHNFSKRRLEETRKELSALQQNLMATDIPALSSLQVEEAALSKEKDKVSKDRLEEVRKELAALQDELRPVMTRYRGERERLQELQKLRKKKEELQVGDSS